MADTIEDVRVKVFDEFEEKEFKVYKRGNKKMNCTIEVIGETGHHEDDHVANQLVVQLLSYDKTRICLWPVDEAVSLTAVQAMIKRVLQTPIICSFQSIQEFQSYLHSKLDDYRQSSAGVSTTFKATGHIGMQYDGTLVVSPDIQLGMDGNVELGQRFIIHPRCLVYSNPRDPILTDDITPFQELIKNIQVAYRYNMSAVIAAIAGYVYLLNYPNDIARGRNVPTLVLYSTDVDTGKTSTINLLQILFAQSHRQKINRISDARFKNEAMQTTYPLIMDDVVMSKEIKGRIVNVFTGCGEKDSTSAQSYKIRSGLLLSSNFTVDDVERVSTKVLPIGFVGPSLSKDVTKDQAAAFNTLKHLAEASSGLLIKQVPRMCSAYIGLTTEQESQLRVDTARHVTAHPRITQGYACLKFFIKQLLTLASVPDTSAEVIKDVFLPMKEKVPVNRGDSGRELIRLLAEEQDTSRFLVTGMFNGQPCSFVHRPSMPTSAGQVFDEAKSSQGFETTIRRFQTADGPVKRKCYVIKDLPPHCLTSGEQAEKRRVSAEDVVVGYAEVPYHSAKGALNHCQLSSEV